MKLNQAKATKTKKSFVKTEDLEINVADVRNKITEIHATYKGESKTFKVRDFKILDAWQQMEKWLNKK